MWPQYVNRRQLFVMPYYFRLHLLSTGAAWLQILTVSFAPGIHYKKIIKKIRIKLLHKHACFGFFQKPVVVQSVCLLISPISNFARQFHDTEMHVMLRGPDYSEKHERKSLFLRTKDEKLSWALCLTECGSSCYAKLDHYYKPSWKTEGCTWYNQALSSIYFFPDLKLPHIFKRWQNTVPLNTLSVNCCCCVFPQEALLYPPW